jgi:hypothetical protein
MQQGFRLGLLLCACALLMGCPSDNSTPAPAPSPSGSPTITLNTPAGGIMMGTWASVTATFTGNVTTQTYTLTGNAPTDSGAGVPFNPSGRFTTITYSNNNTTCVHDNLTNLTWVQDPTSVQDSSVNFLTAVYTANALNLGGYCGFTSGWRLPTVSELYSLVNYSQSSPQDWLNTSTPGFSGVQGSYWSSSVYVPISAARAWVVDMLDGYVSWDIQSRDNVHYVWPVRVGQ